MAKLIDDLLQELLEERTLINSQLELLNPLALSLRKPVAQRLLKKSFLIFLEIASYLLALGTLAVIFFFSKLQPLYIISELRVKGPRMGYSSAVVDSLFWTVNGMILLIALMWYMLARSARKIRLKNTILSLSGRDVKIMVGQHLQRKAIIDTLIQRHAMEIPDFETDISSIDLTIKPTNNLERPTGS